MLDIKTVRGWVRDNHLENILAAVRDPNLTDRERVTIKRGIAAELSRFDPGTVNNYKRWFITNNLGDLLPTARHARLPQDEVFARGGILGRLAQDRGLVGLVARAFGPAATAG